MPVLQVDHCQAALLRGRLRHSWLENQIINRSADYIVTWHGTSTPEATDFEKRIVSGGDFYRELERAHELVGIMVESFSPMQLIESGVLMQLPTDVKVLIKQVIHNAYLEKTQITNLVDPLKTSVNKFALELERFTETWCGQPPAERGVAKRGFIKLQECARELHELLGCLPEGVVLP